MLHSSNKKIKVELPQVENVDGVMIGDCFCLHYYNINVFFYVSKIDTYEVAVYELAKRTIKYNGQLVDVLCPNYKATSMPLVVEGSNCFSKTKFYVKTGTVQKFGTVLKIPIKYTSRIYEKVSNSVPFPETGLFYAFALKEETENGLRKYFWETKTMEKRKKYKKVKIIA